MEIEHTPLRGVVVNFSCFRDNSGHRTIGCMWTLVHPMAIWTISKDSGHSCVHTELYYKVVPVSLEALC